jgi:hypothetical protein
VAEFAEGNWPLELPLVEQFVAPASCRLPALRLRCDRLLRLQGSDVIDQVSNSLLYLAFATLANAGE